MVITVIVLLILYLIYPGVITVIVALIGAMFLGVVVLPVIFGGVGDGNEKSFGKYPRQTVESTRRANKIKRDWYIQKWKDTRPPGIRIRGK